MGAALVVFGAIFLLIGARWLERSLVRIDKQRQRRSPYLELLPAFGPEASVGRRGVALVHDGIPVRFEIRSRATRQVDKDGKRDAHREAEPWTLVAAVAPGTGLHFALQRRDRLGAPLAGVPVGIDEVTTGDDAFDQAYRLRGGPAASARELFDAATIERIKILGPFLLTGGDGTIQLEVRGTIDSAPGALEVIGLVAGLAARMPSANGVAGGARLEPKLAARRAKALARVRRGRRGGGSASMGMVW